MSFSKSSKASRLLMVDLTVAAVKKDQKTKVITLENEIILGLTVYFNHKQKFYFNQTISGKQITTMRKSIALLSGLDVVIEEPDQDALLVASIGEELGCILEGTVLVFDTAYIVVDRFSDTHKLCVYITESMDSDCPSAPVEINSSVTKKRLIKALEKYTNAEVVDHAKKR